MRQYIFEQERSGRDTKRKERLSRVLEEEHCQYVKAGGSPRAFLKLVAASLCQAFLDSRDKIDEEDVIKVIDNVLRHRIHMDVHARMAGISPEDVIHKVCERILSPDNR
ncbi:MAG: hypothetical protein Q8N91_04400 [Candidatus Omnitrophota bacterium]|nr:hypothetical protein [Candidatus Omnitrophota bacterium]